MAGEKMAENTIIAYQQILSCHRPDDTVIAWTEQRIFTLSDLRCKVDQLCALLNQHSEHRWALCIEDSFLFTAGLLALIYTGKTPILLGHTRPALINEQKTHYDGLLTDSTLASDCPCLCLNALPEQHAKTTQIFSWHEETNVFLFTSGSTSEPKIIQKPLPLLEQESILLAEQFGHTLKNSQVFATVSHLHLYGLTFKILLPLVLSLPFYAGKTHFQEELPKTKEQQYSLITSPAFLKRLDEKLISDNLSMIFSAGGVLPFEDAQTSKRVLGHLPLEIYGSSETGVVAFRQQKQTNEPFTPFEAVKVTKTAEDLICVASPLMMPDTAPELNDLIDLQPQGFYLKGRLGKMVKIEEKRISLSEVESRILSLPEIKHAVVFPLQHNHRTFLAAVLVLTQEAKIRQESLLFNQIKTHLKNWLEPVAIPKRWRIVEALPQNSQGKQSYYDLKALFL